MAREAPATRTKVVPDEGERPFFERGSYPAVRRAVALLVAGVIVLGAIWYLQEPQAPPAASGIQDGQAYDLAGNPVASLSGTSAGPRVGKPAPDFALLDLEGQRWQLSSLRGKTVVLNFWATWCPPCRAEMPELDDLAQRHQDQDVLVVGVNLREDAAAVKRFTKTLGITFPILLDSQGAVFNGYNIVALPTTYFIDRDSVVRDVNIGALNDKGLERKLEAARN